MRLVSPIALVCGLALLASACSLTSANEPPTPTATPVTETPAAIETPQPPAATAPLAPPASTTRPDTPVTNTPAGSTSATATPAPFVPPPGTRIVDAPIDDLDVLVRESFPPGYTLHIEAGLPSGCAKQATHELSRQGDVIRVRVLNTTIPNGICTAIYGMYELNLDLGTNFQSGRAYRVEVNDKVTTFTAQ
jgi:hypothetical protein